MKHAVRALVPGPLILALIVFVAPATTAPAAGDPLSTRVTMLVGFPGDGGDASVLVVPGTVLPVAGPSPRLKLQRAADDSAVRAELVRELADKLERAVGLARVEVGYSEDRTLAVGKATTLAGPHAASTIRGSLTLLGFNKELATYRVELQQGGVTLADSKVAVERGGRAVVGGLDGDEAPYFFLVLQPASHAIRVTDDVAPPRKLHSVAPHYTEEARKERIEGVVILQAEISEEGRVENIEVLKSLSHGLTEAAMESLRQWTFAPATLDGEPVAVYYNLTFNFRLQKDADEDREEETDEEREEPGGERER